MNYWILVDFALAALLAVCVYTGWQKGFVKSASFLLALGIALAAGIWLTGLTTAKLSDKHITPWVEKTITKMIDKRENSEQLYDYLDRGKSTLDSMWEKVKAKLSASDEEEKIEDEKAGEASVLMRTSGQPAKVEKTPVEWIAGIIGRVIGGTLLFILFFSAVFAVLQALIEYLNFVDRIPVVGFCNKVFGIALGFMIGACMIMAPVYVMNRMMPEFLKNLGVFTAENFSDSRVISLVIRLLS